MTPGDPDAELARRLADARPEPALRLSAELRRNVVAAAERVPPRPDDLWSQVAILVACGLALLVVAIVLA